MESLKLPCDVMSWEGKFEPLSPLHNSLEESWIFEDDFATHLLTDNDIILNIEDNDKQTELLLELQQLQKDFNDDDWFDKRADLPTLDNYSVEPTIPIVVQQIKTQNTDELLSEFEAVYDAVELTHLTPPQTPPQHFNGTVLNQAFNYPELPHQTFQIILPTFTEDFTSKLTQNTTTPQSQPQQQQHCDSIDEVDEIIRSVSRDLPDFTDDDNSSGSVSNPSLSPRSEFSYSGSNYSQDDDWIPSTCSSSSLKESSSSAVSKRRPRPYARGTEDKKSRKKEQNKNAATRYRQKKKAEIDQILDVEKDLLDDHKKLYTKYKDVRREISYLKSLMRELFKSKGLLD